MKNNKKTDRNVSLLRLVKAMRHVKLPWLMLVAYVAVALVSPLANIFAANAMGDMIDANGQVSNLVLFSMVAMYVFFAFTTPASTLITGISQEKINLSLRGLLWSKLMRIPSRHYDRDGGESLVSRVTTDCDFAGSLLIELLGMVSLIYSTVTYIVTLFSTNMRLAAFTMILAPLSVLVGAVYSKLYYLVGRRTQGALADATNYLIERTKLLPLVKAANTAQEEGERGKTYFQAQYKARVLTGYMGQAYSLIDTALRIGGLLITFILGASLVNQGTLTTGEVVAFYQISGSVTLAFANLIMSVGNVRRAVGCMSRVVTTLETESEDTAKGRNMDVANEDLRLENVTFGYTAGQPVLTDLNCLIPKGKVTAVIGANGSGKTTLFKLLERMYTPDKGGVYFGQTPAGDFSLSAWRRAFGLVAQERPVLEGTLRENITYGCQRDVTDEELWEVARMANLEDVVKSLPDGFDSYVAPGGRNFSGGQSQRIAIARAIMHDPDYLLLDEATSSLDAKSERAVADALNTLMEGRTTVIIAHSLSAIRHADHVLVMKDGKITASGSPAEIIKISEDYKSFVTSQAQPVKA